MATDTTTADIRTSGLSHDRCRHVHAVLDRLTVDWRAGRIPRADDAQWLAGAAAHHLGSFTRTAYVPPVLSDAERADIDVAVAKVITGRRWSDEALATVVGADWWNRLLSLAAIPEPVEPPKPEPTYVEKWRPTFNHWTGD
jgi:hypothetical protein